LSSPPFSFSMLWSRLFQLGAEQLNWTHFKCFLPVAHCVTACCNTSMNCRGTSYCKTLATKRMLFLLAPKCHAADSGSN
jgi:hypothetical protein